MSLVSGIVFAVPVTAFGIAYALGNGGTFEDNWLAYTFGLTSFAGLLGSLVAFVLGVVAAKLAPVRDRRIWVPVGIFPALTTFLVIGEVFWWE